MSETQSYAGALAGIHGEASANVEAEREAWDGPDEARDGGAGLPVVNERIPFPGTGQQVNFRSAFARALRKCRRISRGQAKTNAGE